MTEFSGQEPNFQPERSNRLHQPEDMGAGPSIERRHFLEEIIIDRIAERRAQRMVDLLQDRSFQIKVLDLLPAIIKSAAESGMAPQGMSFPVSDFEFAEFKTEMLAALQIFLRSSGMLKGFLRNHIEQEYNPAASASVRLLDLKRFLSSHAAGPELMQRFEELEQQAERRFAEKGQLIDHLVNLALEKGLEFAMHEEAEKWLIRGKFPTREHWLKDQDEKLANNIAWHHELQRLVQEVDPHAQSELAQKLRLAGKISSSSGPFVEVMKLLRNIEADRIYN